MGDYGRRECGGPTASRGYGRRTATKGVERLEIAEQTLALKSGMTAVDVSGEAKAVRALIQQWLTLYRQVMGHGTAMGDGEMAAADIMLHGKYQRMTANPAVFDKSDDAAWFDLGRSDVRQLVENWASMILPVYCVRSFDRSIGRDRGIFAVLG